jgi:GNAT superfamily N-acetyltransferase
MALARPHLVSIQAYRRYRLSTRERLLHNAPTRETPPFGKIPKGVLVGLVHVAEDSVEDLHVDPQAWGNGFGSRLLDDAERQIGQAHRSAHLELRAFNERARVFYKRRGWIEHRRYPGTECGSPVENIEMRKQL